MCLQDAQTNLLQQIHDKRTTLSLSVYENDLLERAGYKPRRIPDTDTTTTTTSSNQEIVEAGGALPDFANLAHSMNPVAAATGGDKNIISSTI